MRNRRRRVALALKPEDAAVIDRIARWRGVRREEERSDEEFDFSPFDGRDRTHAPAGTVRSLRSSSVLEIGHRYRRP